MKYLILLITFCLSVQGGFKFEDIKIPASVDPQVGGLDVMPNGELAACFHRGQLMIYNPQTKTWREFASGLHEPLGIVALSNTEFAETVRKDLGIEKNKTKSEYSFSIAEDLWYLDNQKNALDTLRSIVRLDSSSEFALKSGYFLGYQYDYTLINPDSALTYYTWVQSYFPDSEQAAQSKTRINRIKTLLVTPDSSKILIDSVQTSIPDSIKFVPGKIDSLTKIIPQMRRKMKKTRTKTRMRTKMTKMNMRKLAKKIPR